MQKEGLGLPHSRPKTSFLGYFLAAFFSCFANFFSLAFFCGFFLASFLDSWDLAIVASVKGLQCQNYILVLEKIYSG